MVANYRTRPQRSGGEAAMSTVGLKDARRSALTLLADCRNADDFALALQAVGRTMLRALHTDKLIDDEGRPTKRGHAALAAPRMTQGEYMLLECLDAGMWTGARVVWQSCIDHGWVDNTSTPWRLTTAGRIALNNVHAAIGSPEYREDMT
jgi:hypothetical protein